MEGGRGDRLNKHNNQLVGEHTSIHTSGRRGWVGVAGGVGEEGGGEQGERGSGDDDDTKERSVARSSTSFSLEEEVEKPWPLPLL